MDAKHDRGEPITPLCGLPLAVKDTIDVEGYRTTAATPGLKGEYQSLTLTYLTCAQKGNSCCYG